jgi:hypothetical protein
VTTSRATEVAKRRPTNAPTTFAEDLAQAILAMVTAETRIVFPSSRFRDDPAAFCREVLGFELWAKQVEILEAVRDHRRVAVRSGHKVGKSSGAAALALWYWASYPDARVVMTSTTSRQVDQILWRELRMRVARAGRCLACIAQDPDGRRIPRPCPHSTIIVDDVHTVCGELARTGLRSDDFREIVGFTAREAEAVAGVSGKHLLYIVDEASGVPDVIYEAIEGNRAGGASILLIGNPTKTSGEHYEAFRKKKHLYHCITVSSEETPNALSGQCLVPGLAEREWIEEKKLEWGEDSPQYKIRVKGVHAENEDGCIFSVHAIVSAEQRWHELALESSERRVYRGRLWLGIDPAGATGTGDESAFCARRGPMVLRLVTMRGLTAEAHTAHALGMIADLEEPEDRTFETCPVVVIDRSGSIGAELYGTLRARLGTYEAVGAAPPFVLVGVRSSEKPERKPDHYGTLRDELAASTEAWMREGGAIPEDTKLAAELHALRWVEDQRQRLKVTPKDELRKMLDRSPDRYDALALAVWEPAWLRPGFVRGAAQSAPETAPSATGHPAPVHRAHEDTERALDPYSAESAWRG